MEPNVDTAIIPAAGKGTRMYPLSIACPKELLPMGQSTIIDEVLSECYDAGIRNLVIVTDDENKPLLRTYISEHARVLTSRPSMNKAVELFNIRFVNQPDTHPGLLGAVQTGLTLLEKDQPFALVLPDEVIKDNSLKDMISVFTLSNIPQIGTMVVSQKDTNLYGIVDTDKHTLRHTIIEKPTHTYSRKAVIGRYVLVNNSMFDNPSDDEHQSITPILSEITFEHGDLSLYAINGNIRFDCGNLESYQLAVLNTIVRQGIKV